MNEKDKALKAGESALNNIEGVGRAVFEEEREAEDGQIISEHFIKPEGDSSRDEVERRINEVYDERFVLITERRHGLYVNVKTTVGDYRSTSVTFDVSGEIEEEIRVDDEEVAIDTARRRIEEDLPDELELRVLEVENDV